MYDLIYDRFSLSGDESQMERRSEVVVVENPSPDELKAFWDWVDTLNPDPEIPF